MSRAALQFGRALERLIALADATAPDLAFRLKRHFLRPDMGFQLALLRRQGFAPATVIDVGAFAGDWSAECRRAFPAARILMIEPWPERVAHLRALCARDPQLAVEGVLLGAGEGTVHFAERESNSGVVDPGTDGAVPMPITTLDRVLARTGFDRPQLLKVDVQGHDLEVLKGATTALDTVEVLIVEISLIALHPAAPPVRTIVDWLDDRDFQLRDIAGLIRRPVDDALWQMDAVFTRRHSRFGRVASGW